MGDTSDPMWEATVLHGRASVRVALAPPALSGAAWLEALQEAVAQQTGVAPAHQKLLFRGKAVAATTEIPSGAKLMLLKNARFHESEAARPKAATTETTEDAREEENKATAVSAVASQRLGLDASEIDEDHVLVQAARGKSVFEFLVPADATVASVKSRVGGALGLPGAALRLLLKGKTPKDEDVLSSFVAPDAASRVLKCMVLLQAKQHDLMEREETFRELQNELTKVESDAQRLAKVMFRNLLAPDEVLFRLHALEDHVGRLESNLEILEDQLKATKLAQGSATLNALVNAKQQSLALKARVESLAKQFENGR